MEVAVKKLKKGASTLERIKFLQEAAIMAQFSNPNVLGIMGVIKQEEEVCHLAFINTCMWFLSAKHKQTYCFSSQQVMIIVELMSNGDLRDFLVQMRPK